MTTIDQQRINQVVAETAKSLDLSVVHLSVRQARHISISLLLEKLDQSPMTIEDCSAAHRHLQLRLKVDKLLSSPYTLEVSSAGVDRPLFSIEDYQRFKGKEVKVRLKKIITVGNDEIKSFKGQIVAVNEEQAIVFATTKHQQLIVPLSEIKDAELAISASSLRQALAAKNN